MITDVEIERLESLVQKYSTRYALYFAFFEPLLESTPLQLMYV